MIKQLTFVFLFSAEFLCGQVDGKWSLKAFPQFYFLKQNSSKLTKNSEAHGSKLSSNLFNIGISRSITNKSRFTYEIGITALYQKHTISDVYSTYNYYQGNQEHTVTFIDKPDYETTSIWLSFANQLNFSLPPLFNHCQHIEASIDIFGVGLKKTEYTTTDIPPYPVNHVGFNTNYTDIDLTIEHVIGIHYNIQLLKYKKINHLFLRAGIQTSIFQRNNFYLYRNYWSVGLNYRWSKTKKETIE